MCCLEIRPFEPRDETAVVTLWRRCGLTRPWNDPHRDVQRKLQDSPAWFLVGVLNGEIVASIMAGYDGHRGWLNYLAVASEHRRQGCARAMVAAAELCLQRAGCPKVNLQVRAANESAIRFYRALGYATDEVVSMGKRLEIDE